jgi:hypothetical protein
VTTTPLARRLGPFDATMIVMCVIIGSGIFINPYVVARTLPSAPLIGAFVYAELAALRPEYTRTSRDDRDLRGGLSCDRGRDVRSRAA